jgi:hypothetical protein
MKHKYLSFKSDLIFLYAYKCTFKKEYKGNKEYYLQEAKQPVMCYQFL